MAGKISLTKTNLESLHLAFDHYFPEGILYVSDKPFSSGEFNWSNRASFIDFVYRLTDVKITSDRDIKSIKEAQQKLEELVSSEPVETKQGESSEKGVRDVREAEREIREKGIKESVEKAKRDVKSEIDRQKKLREEINDRKIYKQVKKEESVKLADNQKAALETLKKAAQENPKALENQIEAKIYNRLKSTLPAGTPNSEIDLMAKKTSVSLVKNFRGESLAEQVALANQVSKNIDILHRAGISNAAALEIKNTAERVVAEGALEFQFNRKVLLTTFGQELANIYGPKNLDKIQVTLSPAKFEGAESYGLSDISSHYSNSLQGQGVFLDGLKGFGESEIKERLTSHLISLAEKALPEGFLESALSNQAVQAALDIYGVGIGESIVWEGTNLFGRIAVGTGYGPTLGWLGSFTGIDFGVSAATTAVASEVVGETIATGAVYTTETMMTLGSAGASTIAGIGVEVATTTAVGGVTAGVTTGAIETVAVAAAPATGGLSLLIGAATAVVTTIVGPKVIRWIKDNIHKVKDFIIIGSAALLGGVIGIATGFGGLSGGLIGGFAGWGAAKLSTGGLGGLRASANIGAKNVMNVGWAIGATALAGIGGPILTILFVFPIIIALILFIINSGAYVVPPSVSSIVNINEYIDVQKEATPPGPFKNTELPLKIKYTITITAKKEALTNVTVKDECIVITKSGQQNCQSPPITVSGGTIAVGTPFTFSYEANYNSSYKDALILNTVTVSANVLSETDRQTESGGTSITIGEPPSACLSIDGPWPAGYKLNLEKAKAKLVGSFSSYVSKVCSSFNKISLLYEPGSKEQYWGWNDGQKSGTATIHFYSLGVKNEADALYTVAHELGHSLANGTKTASIYSRYIAFPGIKSEKPYCFYSATTSWNANESMPEAIALRVVEPRCGSVQQKWPTHNNFLKKYVFN